jgi:hypothetical protein
VPGAVRRASHAQGGTRSGSGLCVCLSACLSVCLSGGPHTNRVKPDLDPGIPHLSGDALLRGGWHIARSSEHKLANRIQSLLFGIQNWPLGPWVSCTWGSIPGGCDVQGKMYIWFDTYTGVFDGSLADAECSAGQLVYVPSFC